MLRLKAFLLFLVSLFFIWPLFALVFHLPLIVLGWVLVPLAALCRAYEAYQGADGVGTPRTQYRFTWRFMWLWDNDEDGIANDTYAPSKWFDSMFWKIVYWSCIRNPVNNFRFAKYVSCIIDPNKIWFVGSLGDVKENRLMLSVLSTYDTYVPQWFFIWQGMYTGLFIHFVSPSGHLWRFWVGWKLVPLDVFTIRPSDYRVGLDGYAHAGWVLQFKKKVKNYNGL